MNPNNAHILTINGGSSSIKFARYRAGEPLERGTYGKLDRIGLSGTTLTFNEPTKKERQTRNLADADHSSAVTFLSDWLEEQSDLETTRGIGHRVFRGCNTQSRRLSRRHCSASCTAWSPTIPIIFRARLN